MTYTYNPSRRDQYVRVYAERYGRIPWRLTEYKPTRMDRTNASD